MRTSDCRASHRRGGNDLVTTRWASQQRTLPRGRTVGQVGGAAAADDVASLLKAPYRVLFTLQAWAGAWSSCARVAPGAWSRAVTAAPFHAVRACAAAWRDSAACTARRCVLRLLFLRARPAHCLGRQPKVLVELPRLTHRSLRLQPLSEPQPLAAREGVAEARAWSRAQREPDGPVSRTSPQPQPQLSPDRVDADQQRGRCVRPGQGAR